MREVRSMRGPTICTEERGNWVGERGCWGGTKNITFCAGMSGSARPIRDLSSIGRVSLSRIKRMKQVRITMAQTKGGG